MYPFFVMLSVGAVGSLYGMGRLVAVCFHYDPYPASRMILMKCFAVGQEDILLSVKIHRRVHSIELDWAGDVCIEYQSIT
jgi:hypothetical protein